MNPEQTIIAVDSEPRIGAEFVELLQEIQETPREHWPNLLQMVRLFKETVTIKPRVSDIAVSAQDKIVNSIQFNSTNL